MSVKLAVCTILALHVATSLAGVLKLTKTSLNEDDPCPHYSPMGNFNLSAFLGVWHEIERYPNDIEKQDYCVVTQYQIIGPDVLGDTQQFMFIFKHLKYFQ